MKAVNLLPSDLRSATASGSGGTGASAYAVLAALGILLVVVAVWAVSARQVNDRRNEVATLNAEAAKAEAEAGDLQSFQQFVTTADARAKTVTDLAKKRVDWAASLEQVSRTLPKTSWVTTMAATASTAVTVAGSSNPLRSQADTPAIEIFGCTTSHDDVARLMARLRSMENVDKVALATSTKSDAGGAGASDTKNGGDCRAGSEKLAQFNVVVFFAAPEGAATPADATTAATPAAPTTSTGTTK